MDKAKDFANKPETKEKIEQAREKLSGKDKNGAAERQPAGQAEPTAPAAGGTPPANAQGGTASVGDQPAQGNPSQTP